MVPNDLVRVARIARVLIDAALANRDIQGHIADPRPPRLWTVNGVKENPTVRVEWEHTVVIGGIGESLAAARHKSWGPFIGVLPLQPHEPGPLVPDPLLLQGQQPVQSPRRTTAPSQTNLGRLHRSLVTKAARSTKRRFPTLLSEYGAEVIKRRLRLDPGQFGRAAEGRDSLHVRSRQYNFSILPTRLILLFP